MKLVFRALIAAGLLGALFAAPSQAATKKLEAKIKFPANAVGAVFGAGYAEETDFSAVRQSCPAPGQFDGYTWKLFDLKGAHSKFKVYGPKPAVTQEVPLYSFPFNEYDIDAYGLDAKCKFVDAASTTNSGRTNGGTETFSTKKPVNFIVVVYYSGPYVDLPVTVEAT